MTESICFVGGPADGHHIDALTIVGKYYDVIGHLYKRTDEVRDGRTVFVPARPTPEAS